jgi:hypothetical protein
VRAPLLALPGAALCRDCEVSLLAPSAWRALPDHLRPGYRLHIGRRLCSRCYRRRWDAGTLVDAERLTRTRTEVLEDFLLLASEGYSRRLVAERMGMTYDALCQALHRAAGDPRLAEVGGAR